MHFANVQIIISTYDYECEIVVFHRTAFHSLSSRYALFGHTMIDAAYFLGVTITYMKIQQKFTYH